MTGKAGSDAWAELLWIPLGAGASLPTVRWSGRAYEYVSAIASRRSTVPLFHAALRVCVDGSNWVIEMAPAWGVTAASAGVTMHGPVYFDLLGRSKYFTYEIRCWNNGVIPDEVFAVGSPVRLTLGPKRAHALVALTERVPPLRWGRRARGTREMWNSNSVIAWLLTQIQLPAIELAPPPPGRAPGWQAGIDRALAERDLDLSGLPSGAREPEGERCEHDDAETHHHDEVAGTHHDS